MPNYNTTNQQRSNFGTNMNAQQITNAKGGKWHGSYGLYPALDHSNHDRSVQISDATSGTEQVIITTHSDTSWQDEKSDLVQRGWIDGYHRCARPFMNVAYVNFDRRAKLLREVRRKAANTLSQANHLLWGSTVIDGTLAEKYLRRRNIKGDISSLRFCDMIPHNMWNSSAQFPSLIAMVSNNALKGAIVGCQATFLDARARKSSVAKKLGAERKSLGQISGGAVILGKDQPIMAIAEGIESALSFRDKTGFTCHATLSASNMGQWNPPPILQTLIIAHDNDNVGLQQAQNLADRMLDHGIDVHFAPPPQQFNDWNDVAQSGSGI